MQTYCERCGPGLFDEPINAASNVVFLIAAWAAWRDARREDALNPGVWVLIALAAGVGVGSALWHTFATPWAMWLDIVPIILFECAFLALYARWAAGAPWALLAALLVPFVGLGFWLGQFTWMNGALAYAPVLAAMAVVGWHHSRTARRESLLLPLAAVVFCLALVCRTIDLVVCRQFPVGTHFLWHVFNGFVVYAAMRGVVLRTAQATADAAGDDKPRPRGLF